MHPRAKTAAIEVFQNAKFPKKLAFTSSSYIDVDVLQLSHRDNVLLADLEDGLTLIIT